MKVSSKEIRKRMVVLFFFFMAGILVLGGRLFYLQVVKGAEYKEKAAEQQTRDEVVTAKRGTIYDRNMKALAQSATAEIITVNPREIAKVEKDELKSAKGTKENTEKIVRAFVELLGLDEAQAREKISLANKSSVIIKRKVEKSVADQIRALRLKGVNFEEDSKRYYPYSSFASHVVGFTGVDNQGLEGLESVLNDVLSGTAGRVQVVKDARNIEMPYKHESYQAAQNGQNVVLTIDEVLQHYVEKHLETARIDNKLGNGAAAIMMNPKTGEILAMAVQPDFDLNTPMEIVEPSAAAQLSTLLGDAYNEYLNAELRKQWRNKAVVDSYEPGSTFKAIVAAAAIEEGLVSLDSGFFCGGGKQVGGRYIKCWKRGGHGALTFAQGVQGSCNVVFMELGARLGKERFLKYFKAFGLTEKTGFLLPGEMSGIFYKKEDFNEVELATSSFGQGPTITPLQMVTAVSAVVNGGYLMKPQILKSTTDDAGNVTQSFEPKIVRQVISEKTSETVRSVLESVVAVGTGKGAYVKGYRIGGKTGTSEKLPRSAGKKIASFLGFAPADDPQIVCLILLDEPNGALTQGGQIAAPVMGKIMEDSLRYLGVEPKYTEAEAASLDVSVPELRGMSVGDATKAAKDAKLKVSVKGNQTAVTDQIPKPGSKLHENSIVILYTEEKTAQNTVSVPAVIGMKMADAKYTLSAAGLNIKVSGGGVGSDKNTDIVAVGQSPAAGAQVELGSVVYVDFVDTDVD